MKFRYFIFIVFTLLSLSVTQAQNVTKIDKKLNKLFRKEQFEKCREKSNLIKRKYPNLAISYYYLSKIDMQYFIIGDNTPNKKQFKYLKSASGYTKKINKDYPAWAKEVQDTYKAYINQYNNIDKTFTQKLVYNYTKTFKDTLPVYFEFYNKVTATHTLPGTLYKIPITDSLRTKLITFASALVGIPYHYTGESPSTGFDCSGFVLYCYHHIGIDLPHNAQLQSQVKGEMLTLDEAEPGDLIFFGQKTKDGWRTQHAGIFFADDDGETKVIHCVSRGVTIDGNNSSWSSYWKDKVLFIKRIPELSVDN